MKEFFKLYSSCILVRGAKENLIYDLGRGDFFSIPHEVTPILKDIQSKDIASLTRIYGNEILDFINQFIESEVGFITDEPEVFPDISLKYSVPHVINNAVIEITSLQNYDYTNIIRQIDELGCLGYQIRILKALSISELKKILDCFKDTKSTFIEVLYPYLKSNDYNDFENLFETYPRLLVLNFYGAPEDFKLPKKAKYNERIAFYSKDIIKDTSEIIAANYFAPTLLLFIESQNHNLGLNKKISITKTGDIKNYIHHKKDYGNVSSVMIGDVVNSKEFQELWYISNERIKVCQDCQYRYACISTSDLIQVKNKLYKKKEMCSFDPTSNSWNQN